MGIPKEGKQHAPTHQRIGIQPRRLCAPHQDRNGASSRLLGNPDGGCWKAAMPQTQAMLPGPLLDNPPPKPYTLLYYTIQYT